MPQETTVYGRESFLEYIAERDIDSCEIACGYMGTFSDLGDILRNTPGEATIYFYDAHRPSLELVEFANVETVAGVHQIIDQMGTDPLTATSLPHDNNDSITLTFSYDG